jgi:tetratricopeptide (TPR) repeat protein
MNINQFLISLNLEKYIEKFEEEEVTFEDLISFSEEILDSLKIKNGPRIRIINALKNHNFQLEKESNSTDSNGNHFFRKLCDDEQLWFKPAFRTSTSVIAHEYARLYKLLKEGQSFGAMLQIKDLMEVLLKFPVLICVSNIYSLRERSDAEIKVLVAMLEKPLSLGDWEKIGGKLVKLPSTHPTLKQVLKRTLKLFNDEKIVNWRNIKLGHGALSFDIDEDFRKDLVKKLKALRLYFIETLELDKQIQLYLKQHGNEHRLSGEEAMSHIEKDTSDISVRLNDELTVPLFPFILSSDNSIYFFDTYYSNKDKTMVLDYTKGKKKIHQEVNELIKGTRRDLDFIIPKRSTVDDRTYSMIEAEILNKIGEVKDFQSPRYLIDDISAAIHKHPKGLFLIQMERGTGKTTFTRALDEMSLNKYQEQLNCSVRAYYINDSFSYKMNYFSERVHDILRQDKDGKNRIVGIEGVHSNSKNKKGDFARMINEFSEEHRTHFDHDKLLLVIDGLDEIPGQVKESIFDFIPDETMLDDGVYILLTSRMKEELTPFTQFNLDQFTFTEQFEYKRDYEQNRDVLVSYLKKELLSNSTMTKEHERIFDELIIKAESRFLYLKAIKELLVTYKGELDVKDLPKGSELFSFYLNKLHDMYGNKFYENLRRILLIVSGAFEGLTFREISCLSGEDKPTFTFLAYLLDLRIFLKVDRSYRGNLITISHDEWKKLIFDKYETELDQLTKGWLEDILYLKENPRQMNWASVECDGEVYLITNTLNYLEFINDENITNQIYNQSFVEFSHQLANYLKEYSVVEYQRVRRIQLLNQQLSILEAVQGKETDIADTYMLRGEAYYLLMKYKEAFQDYNEAIKRQENLFERQMLFDPDSLPLSYAKRGAAYRRAGYFDEAVEDLTKSINLRNNLLNQKVPVDLISQAEHLEQRGYTYRWQGRFQEALEDINEAIKLLQSLEENQIEVSSELVLNIIMSRGTISLDLGDYESGIEEFEATTTLGRKSLMEEKLIDISQLASSIMMLGNAYNLNKQYDIGLKYCTEAIDLCRTLDQNGQLPNRDYFSSALKYRGEGRCASGDVSGGLDDLDEAINNRRNLLKEGILPKFHTLIETLHARMKVHISHGNKREAILDGEEILDYMDQLRHTGKWVDEILVNTIKQDLDKLSMS